MWLGASYPSKNKMQLFSKKEEDQNAIFLYWSVIYVKETELWI